MPAYDRVDRQAEEIRRGIDAILRNDVKDPRVPEMFTILKVDLTRDLKYAKVHISTMLKGAEKRQNFLKALKSATGFIRHELGKKVFLRSMPELTFLLDDSIEYGVHIQSLLNQISTAPKEESTDDKQDE